MNRTADQAMLAELAWKRGTADGAAARRLEGNGGSAPPEGREQAPRITPADMRALVPGDGAPGTAAGGPDETAAWEEAYELAGDAYTSAYTRAVRGEEDAVSPRVRYLAGPATPDGHPRVLFEDGTEEALPRAAVTGAVVFLLEEAEPGAVPAAAGDIVVILSRREALAVSAGTLVTPDPDLAGPGTPHQWTDLLAAALIDHHLKNGRALDTFAHAGFSDALAARDRALSPASPAAPPPGAGQFFDDLQATGRFLEDSAPDLDADAAEARLRAAARAAGLLPDGPYGAGSHGTGRTGTGQHPAVGDPGQFAGLRETGPELG